MTFENNICLKAVHTAGKKISLETVSQKDECSLNKSVVEEIFCHRGHPLRDLFATFQNKKTHLLCLQAFAIDAIAIS